MKIETLKLVCTELEQSRFPRSRQPEIAVCGRSNVGKSSLLNRLLGRKNIARVSREPGKTRTVNFYLVNERLFLVDLPGYGYARASREARGGWQKVILDYIEKRERLCGVIQLVDSRHPPTREDLVMIQRLVDAERRFLVVFTKSDKVSGNLRVRALNVFRSHFDGFTVGLLRGDGGRGPEIPAIFSSATTGEGKDRIWSWISGII